MADDPGPGPFALHVDDRLADLSHVAPSIRTATTCTRGGTHVYRRHEHQSESDPHAPSGLVRLSVGLEDSAALVADLDQALRASER